MWIRDFTVVFKGDLLPLVSVDLSDFTGIGNFEITIAADELYWTVQEYYIPDLKKDIDFLREKLKKEYSIELEPSWHYTAPCFVFTSSWHDRGIIPEASIIKALWERKSKGTEFENFVTHQYTYDGDNLCFFGAEDYIMHELLIPPFFSEFIKELKDYAHQHSQKKD